MAYYVHGRQVWNYDAMWELLKEAGDLRLAALNDFAFGRDPGDDALRSDLTQLQARLGPDHDLAPLVDGAIAELGGDAAQQRG